MELTYLRRYDWQPGNGTRYDLLYGRTGGMWLITWLKHGGSAGPAMLFDGYIHYTYLMEKLEVNIADATGILKFLEHQGIKVGYPERDSGAAAMNSD